MADPTTRKRAELNAEWLKRNKKISGQLHRTFDTDDGKKTLEWLSELCFANESTIVFDSPDKSAFREGQRFVYLKIQEALAARYE